ncbi:MAG TPA: ferrochelatase [Steroidobacteraceae bacterium]|nr:ferrochelatase [Steroidobacteraceae bacterium]
MRYISSPDFHREGAERIGILLINSGTPASPEPRDVRKFLAGLLSDPRVVELPRALWLPVLYGLILPFRPARSARKYRKIWSAYGSPLLDLSERLRTELKGTLAQHLLAPLSLELGMLYGTGPTVPEALTRLRESGAQRILVVPMFPQYCGSTTGAAYDQVNRELRRWRWLPELRYVAEYHDYPAYIDALKTTVTQHWEARGRTQHLLVSFHGIPERYFHQGDPYFCKCQKTARLLAEELMLQDHEWSVSFQSRFGPSGWLKPYTSHVLTEMPGRGIHEVSVICPGFAVDCLETLEEIEMENRQRFTDAGGSRFDYIPALNARREHASLLASLIAQHCQGWTHVELGLRAAGAARGASA